MKLSTLMLSTALATTFAFAPVAITSADAAGLKIRPAVTAKIKVKPKLKVKPRIVTRIKTRVKIKTAKIRVKAVPRINTPKIVVTKALAPRIKVAPRAIAKVKTTHKIKVVAKLTTTKLPSIKTPATKSPAKIANLPSGNTRLANVGNQRGIKDAIQGARAAEAMKDVMTLGKFRASAAAGLGLATPDLNRGSPLRNQDRIGAVPGAGKKRGMFGDDLGSGPDGFTSLGNSHNRKTPTNPWGVTDGTIVGAMDGIAGDRVRLPVNKVRRSQVTFNSGWLAADPGHETRATVKVHENGREVLGNFRRVDANVPSPSAPAETVEPVVPVEVGTTELRNPDHVQGANPNCRTISCIVNGEKPKGLQMADVKNGGTRVYPGPQDAIPSGSNNGAPMVTQNDVLERYDPDFQTNDQPQEIDPNFGKHE